MPPRRRVVQDGADDVALDALRRQNADLLRSGRIIDSNDELIAMCHRHVDDVRVSRSRSLPFDGSLKPEEFIDWLYQVDEILDFKRVPDDRRVPLVTIRLRSRAQAWWQQLKQTRFVSQQCGRTPQPPCEGILDIRLPPIQLIVVTSNPTQGLRSAGGLRLKAVAALRFNPSPRRLACSLVPFSGSAMEESSVVFVLLSFLVASDNPDIVYPRLMIQPVSLQGICLIVFPESLPSELPPFRDISITHLDFGPEADLPMASIILESKEL
ncbi:hypothetical protein Tco_0128737 [Tanacetum coccineum]